MKRKRVTEDKEEIDMAAITKPSVFEISVDKKDFDKAREEVNEVRLTKSFLDECLEVARKLRKGNND